MTDVLYMTEFRSKHEFRAHAIREPEDVVVKIWGERDAVPHSFLEATLRHEKFFVTNERKSWVAEIIRYEDGDVKVY